MCDDINLSGDETGIFHENAVYSIAADALDSCVTGSSKFMLRTDLDSKDPRIDVDKLSIRQIDI